MGSLTDSQCNQLSLKLMRPVVTQAVSSTSASLALRPHYCFMGQEGLIRVTKDYQRPFDSGWGTRGTSIDSDQANGFVRNQSQLITHGYTRFCGLGLSFADNGHQ